jgi:hypothetical protein
MQQQAQQRQRQAAAAVVRGSSGSIPFAIRPKGARKTRTGRRVAMPEELGRRHRVAVAVVTTSYKINALRPTLRQPRLRLQRPPTAVLHPHKL